MDQESQRNAIAEYRSLVKQQLLLDLEAALLERSRLVQQMQDYTNLSDSIKLLQTNGTRQLQTMMNLGSDIFAQAYVPDATRIFVDIGLGYQADLSWDEAIQFCQRRETYLSKRLDEDNRRIAGIKANVTLVSKELQSHLIQS